MDLKRYQKVKALTKEIRRFAGDHQSAYIFDGITYKAEDILFEEEEESGETAAANALALEACADLADETADTIRELEQETSPRIQQQLREAIDRKVSEMIRLLESVRPG